MYIFTNEEFSINIHRLNQWIINRKLIKKKYIIKKYNLIILKT